MYILYIQDTRITSVKHILFILVVELYMGDMF